MCPLRLLFALLQLHLLVFLRPASAASPTQTSTALSRRGGAWCPYQRWGSHATPAHIPSAFIPVTITTSGSKARALPKQEVRPSNPRAVRVTKMMVEPVRRTEVVMQATPAAVAEPTTAPMKASTETSTTQAANAPSPAPTRKASRNPSQPLEVHVIGLSHHNAAVEVREKLSIPEANWNEAAEALCSYPAVAEASVLSTCNRFEIYFAATDSYAAFHAATQFLEKHSGLPQTVLRKNLFLLSGEDAIWHLMRVAGGLDSLVVGEGQILSQVKQCYTHGIEETGKAGKVVSRLLNCAVAAGKRVRTETGISKGAVSISSAAVEFSEHKSPTVLGKEFEEAGVAIIGAGKMSRLLMIHLASQGIKKITLLNRSLPRAEELAAEFPEMEVDIKLMDELWPVMKTHEVIYTSTSASGCILTKENMKENGLEDGRKMMIVDISVPRNVETEVSELSGIEAFNVDHLKEVVDRNTAMRKKQILEAEDLLLDELNKFRSWQFSLGAIPAITRLQEKAEAMRMEEMKKATKKLSKLSDKELETVERLTKGIVNKLLHGPMQHLRATENLESTLNALKTLKAVFEL